MKTYQAWIDKSEITFATKEKIKKDREQGFLDEEAVLLHTVHTDTWEEAMAVHHIKMGWEPYKPEGRVENCAVCDSIYYPDGSGECPKCEC